MIGHAGREDCSGHSRRGAHMSLAFGLCLAVSLSLDPCLRCPTFERLLLVHPLALITFRLFAFAFPSGRCACCVCASHCELDHAESFAANVGFLAASCLMNKLWARYSRGFPGARQAVSAKLGPYSKACFVGAALSRNPCVCEPRDEENMRRGIQRQYRRWF